ncbi:exodeoxyribonuclease I [Orbaceae bacterium ac157xtp]
MKNTSEQATFYFHDYETFGTNPALDRPAQFAGIRTDNDLNIIEDPLIIYCQPAPDYLPYPEAVLITGITPQVALQQGVCEAKFAKKIHQAFSVPNTCILGYNNIRFDDEVTRNILYRNFYDPYAYSWQNGNSRWDLLDVVRATYALRPEGINWAFNEDNLPSFRLEHLTKENGIAHQNAHDAMADVYATIEMAKLIKQKQPKLFDYFFKLRDKKQVSNLLDVINMTPVVHISGMLGAYRGNTALVAPINFHPTQSNSIIVCDLSGDIDALINLSAEQIREKLYTKTEDLEELEARIPLKLIHVNKCPIVAPANTLLPTTAKRLNIELDLCQQNLEKLKQNRQLIQNKITQVFTDNKSFETKNDVDSQIYQGFFGKNDKAICDIIRDTQPQNLDTLNLTPDDDRINKLLFRYKARNYPQFLNEQDQQRWQDYRRDKLNTEVLNDYIIKLENLVQVNQQSPAKLNLLKELYLYAQYLSQTNG